MAESLCIAVLAGTTRVARESIQAARYIAEFGKTQGGVEIIFVDPLEFNFAGDGNDPEGKDPRYSEITAKADAFFIVTPEYNHSFPGSLKRMLDSELQNYVHKAVAFAGCSSGAWGGVRAIEALVMSVREMGLVPTYADVHFPHVADVFEADGSVKAALSERYTKNVQAAYSELIWMGQALKNGRNNKEKTA